MSHKKIETPEKLWELFVEYRDYVKANPVLVHDFVGKDGRSDHRKKERPLSLDGFECWLHEKKVIKDIAAYFNNEEGRYSEYIHNAAIIKKIIRADQIEGAMCGIYHSGIAARLNGLAEKIENNITGNLNVPNLPDIGSR